jgi:hypothetical protein
MRPEKLANNIYTIHSTNAPIQFKVIHGVLNNKTPKYSAVVVKPQENYLHTHTQQQ